MVNTPEGLNKICLGRLEVRSLTFLNKFYLTPLIYIYIYIYIIYKRESCVSEKCRTLPFALNPLVPRVKKKFNFKSLDKVSSNGRKSMALVKGCQIVWLNMKMEK